MNPTVFMSIIEPILLMVFLGFLVLFVYFGITFVHHWNFYSFNVQSKRIMQGLYFFGSIVILLTLLFFIGLYIVGYGI